MPFLSHLRALCLKRSKAVEPREYGEGVMIVHGQPIDPGLLGGHVPYGAVFTLTIGADHTHLHTQGGVAADPVECLRKAIGALTDEMARVQRCPRQKALAGEGIQP